MPRVIPEYKEEAQKRILEVATRVILEKGFPNVKMDDIAKEAGISRPTLYLYYKNKEDLLLAVVTSLINDDIFLFRDSILSEVTSPDGHFFDLMTEHIGDKYLLFFDVLSSARAHPSLIREIGKLHDTNLKRIIEQIHENKIPGFPPGMDPIVIANAMMSMFIGLKIRMKMGLSPDQAREVWKVMIASLFKQGKPLENG